MQRFLTPRPTGGTKTRKDQSALFPGRAPNEQFTLQELKGWSRDDAGREGNASQADIKARREAQRHREDCSR
eukprot:12389224-Heterocapsa_arctica.AAC.1